MEYKQPIQNTGKPYTFDFKSLFKKENIVIIHEPKSDTIEKAYMIQLALCLENGIKKNTIFINTMTTAYIQIITFPLLFIGIHPFFATIRAEPASYLFSPTSTIPSFMLDFFRTLFTTIWTKFTTNPILATCTIPSITFL